MITRLRHVWGWLTTGYWFVPGVMTVVGAAFAMAIIAVDRRVLVPGQDVDWAYSGGADGAKTLLSAVAGSVITVAGVVFSITVAALTQASSQFGPRLLRNFMRDTANQVVLGTFVSTFLYCLLVLRAVRGGDEAGTPFVPHASVTVAVLLAAASIAVLIYFIHHVSLSLQAPTVIANVASELAAAIGRIPKSQEREVARGHELPDDFDRRAVTVVAAADGYVQAIDFDGLVSLARAHDLLIRLERRPGDHVIEGNPLARAYPANRWEERCEAKLRGAFILGGHRTDEQDVEYPVRQMVEVAVRALSPGINDPFTAINAIDALAAGVCRAARHGLPSPHHFDDDGTLRVVCPTTTFAGLVDSAFNQIRQYGRGSVAVTVRLLEVLAECAGQCDETQRAVLFRHVEMTYAAATVTVTGAEDLADVRGRYEAASRALRSGGGTAHG